jgi:lipoprotein-releasing system permease protein
MDDLFAAPRVARAIAAELGPGYEARDWTTENASYFRAVRIEKTMMTIILSLVVAVAAFNIVATLVMVVTDKRAEIAILRTMGLSPGSVMRVFLVQGTAIGAVGHAARRAAGRAAGAQRRHGHAGAGVAVRLQRAARRGVLHHPPALRPEGPAGRHGDGIALVLCLLSTIYPSLRAARTEPAEALRYE